jgi:hypothetical protein
MMRSPITRLISRPIRTAASFRMNNDTPLEYTTPTTSRPFSSLPPSNNSNTSSSNNNNNSNTNRPNKWWERMRDFPQNVQKLLDDVRRYHDINDAARSGAWNGRIPRRQAEQQRMVLQDLRIAVPLVLLWIPPIIGYVPLLMAMVSPRQWMSRQFFNDYEKLRNASIEVSQRRRYYSELAVHAWASMGLLETKHAPIKSQGDLAGPVLDLVPLYRRFEGGFDLKSISRQHLVRLALVSGYLQRFPSILSEPVVSTLLPSAWLCSEIEHHANQVTKDDELLIQEGYGNVLVAATGAPMMTNDEILEACLIRGLPISTSIVVMREHLTTYLAMMKGLREQLPLGKKRSGAFPIFALHVTALRYHLLEVQQRRRRT